MADKIVRNDFLIDLLNLQQDGKQAISAPANWIAQAPMLEVTTDLNQVVDDISTTIIKGHNGNELARWHFLIGSPGNGKSAAMGMLCRNLVNDRSCSVLDEHGVSIEEIEQTTIPYALEVFEGDNRFASAMIVQDASVVRNPFATNVDPAKELVDTLEEAWGKGISLVVCTNRGVIEKAYHEHYLDQEFNDKSWFKILRDFIEKTDETLYGRLGDDHAFDGHKPVFPRIKVTYSYLDNRSLVLGSKILNELITKAVENPSWTYCLECELAALCPFKGNRDWLANDDARANFLRVIRRAEVLSGQVIVFREALAFLSLILAGCPKDYVTLHPCEWVRTQVEACDLFALATRRIYMSVFASTSRYGLETNSSLRNLQFNRISLLRTLIDERDCRVAKSLDRVLENQPPSTDVGVGRLTGSQGTLAEIDPWCECLPPDFIDKWDTDLATMVNCSQPLFTELEKRCAEIWAFLDELIESTPSHEASTCHWALRRWSSNFFIHFGGLLEGRSFWAQELDEYIDILETLLKSPLDRSIQEKRRVIELNRQLEELLAATIGEYSRQDIVPLSESVTLRGRWVADNLRPRIDPSKRAENLSIAFEFLNVEIASLGARAFLWLSRHLKHRLVARCLPEELLLGIIDARIRAAARGRSAYAFSDNDVEIRIDTGGKESFVLSRYDGDVDVERQ